MITVTLSVQEANGVVWHLEQSQRRGMNEETVRGMKKIKQAVKEQDAPLFPEDSSDAEAR